ncbi:MAG: SDR family oxidoreductase [Betaproteobacteria bacterium]|nr:SDR family oxidoreductase [Betaproteobacteria bacterium]
MQLDLSGKTALVTGSSKGIGLAIAELLLRQGCKVAINGRNAVALDQAAEALGGEPVLRIAGDASRPDDARRVVDQALQAWGRLDILICNVGSGSSVPPGQETHDEWQRVFALNLWSATNMVEAASEALAQTRGAIVCVSSICGVEVVPGAPVTYSAAKAALNAYVRGIARPLGKRGVRINAIAPGNILFDGSVWARKQAQDPSAVTAMLEREVSLAALGSPAQVAEWVAWLASSKSSFATGGVYVLDGGQTRS